MDNPVEDVFPLIDYESYWQRACQKHYKGEDCSIHGNSWKQCYAENFTQRLVTSFNVEAGDTLEEKLKYFDIMKYHVFNLDIPTFSADFDISKLPTYFVNLASLSLKYSPVLVEKSEEDILKTKLERKFHMT